MLRKLLFIAIAIPSAMLLVAWAVANRQPITVSFDPFDAVTPAYVVTAPLYLVGFAILIVGVVIGGAAAWLEQGRWRRARRRLAAENAHLQSELERAERQAAPRVPPNSPVRASGADPKRLPAA